MLATTIQRLGSYEQELEIYKRNLRRKRRNIKDLSSSLGKMKNYRVMLAKVTYVYLKPEAEDLNRIMKKRL